MHGFVEELVVEDDPEYQWLDKIRTPRATNEARQTIFLKLSNEVQRRIGLKVLELGANAVIGLVIFFKTHFMFHFIFLIYFFVLGTINILIWKVNLGLLSVVLEQQLH